MPLCVKLFSFRRVQLLKRKVFDPQQLLTDVVIAKNCLTTVGQYTLVQAALVINRLSFWTPDVVTHIVTT
eukprot:4992020-Prorocentrum_lima.AAC.1